MSLENTQRFLVVFKATKQEPPEYFGPFVSKRLAEEFAYEVLPQNGQVAVKPLKARHEMH